MKKIIALLLISVSFLLVSCGETETEVVETNVEKVVVEDVIVEETLVEENIEDILTDEELNTELEEIFNID